VKVIKQQEPLLFLLLQRVINAFQDQTGKKQFYGASLIAKWFRRIEAKTNSGILNIKRCLKPIFLEILIFEGPGACKYRWLG
jgi:hypothetical protein